jgi:hypothetical protein
MDGMRYLVLTPEGIFGPADLVQLAQWAGEGWLTPAMTLEEEGTGRRLAASDLVGLTLNPSQQTSSAGITIAPVSAGHTPAMQPIPPAPISNYRRPGWQPPLFLDDQHKGKRELQLAFIFAIVAPLVALVNFYGVGIAVGSIYCSIVAIRSGRPLGFLALILGIVAIPAAFAVRIWFAMFW